MLNLDNINGEIGITNRLTTASAVDQGFRAYDWEANVTDTSLKNFADQLLALETAKNNSAKRVGALAQKTAALNTLKKNFVGSSALVKTGHKHFPQLDLTKIYLQLVLRVVEPRLINQAKLPLCGIVAVAILVAKKKPEEYCDFCINLLVSGKAKLQSSGN